ncbi:uncharacterized protein BXZ73DRAFT_91751 [Epithele typhae]|uniref:uncharacterized protein n=1 Tax=Epithele typhae TaxID=378194 RepID=UPI002008857D|nr:uncharacterized protein BXZ73DRAFT_91751 [Epithele typhae]KAH9921735.1 hypothetical protein BXZ73DRAFT_91751 [Epithele typhae]
MAEVRPTLRQRRALKSCLKCTPPITPERSAAPSPCNSGRTSPSLVSDSDSSVSSCEKKTVVFCPEEELEEVFIADEWDRTPSSMTPKLSYQDILELKQLRVGLPFSPPQPTSRQPFTTSSPSSSNKPPFPLSRFATAPSHTPSKWKNRSEPSVDPQILPYLDAVPIRLLPLLPDSPEPYPAPPPEPHPQTPTPTASPESRPSARPHLEPPELKIAPPALIPTFPPPSNPPPKRLGFTFLPLLPVEEAPSIPSPIIQPSVPPPPRRKFNMTFVPVNAGPESVTESSPSVHDCVSPNASTELGGGVGMSASADLSPDVRHLGSVTQIPEPSHPSPFISTSSSVAQTFSMQSSRIALSRPQLSASSSSTESDTEPETDGYTDTDAESDAPSTSTFNSSLPSPPCDCEGDGVLEGLKSGPELAGSCPRIYMEAEPGSYFPAIVAVPHADCAPLPVVPPAEAHIGFPSSPPQSSGPGRTPPLSVLYPSPRRQAVTLPGEADPSVLPLSLETDVTAHIIPSSIHAVLTPDSSMPSTPLSLNPLLRHKLTLEALPSPSLVPPSPFELEPHTIAKMSASGRLNASMMANEASKALGVLHLTPTARAADADLPTPETSPMPTLENMRVQWDSRERSTIAVGVAEMLAPSLTRRKSS